MNEHNNWISEAFEGRKQAELPATIHDFQELACALARLREEDAIGILPVVMEGVIGKKDFGEVRAQGDMIIYFLLREVEEENAQGAQARFIKLMTQGERDAVNKWLEQVADRPFVAICMEDYEKLKTMWALVASKAATA